MEEVRKNCKGEQMKNVRLFCGDSAKVLQSIPDESIDLTVTSPPYDNLRKYKGYSFDFKVIAEELYRVTKKGGVIIWVVSDSTIKGSETGTSFKQALYFKKIGFNLYDTMIWEKPSPQAPTEGRYYDVFEYMFVLSKGKPKTLNLLADRKNKSAGSVLKKETRSNKEQREFKEGSRIVKEYSRRFNVWNISRSVNKTNHPAVFPFALARDHILSWSNTGDAVLDCFMGSGTTGIASVMLDRKFIGIEISEEYFETAKKRIEEAEKEFICYGCGFGCDPEDKEQCEEYKKWLKVNAG